MLLNIKSQYGKKNFDILFSMLRNKQFLSSLCAFVLLASGLIATGGDTVVEKTSANWSSAESVNSSNLASAQHVAEAATHKNPSTREYAVRDVVYPKFVENLSWWEWGNSARTQRSSHVAIRRHSDVPRANVTVNVDSIDVKSHWTGSEDFAANFSWELYNLRGYSSNWASCTVGNSNAFRSYDNGSLLMASGNTMNGFTRAPFNQNNYLTDYRTTGATDVARDGNFCLIIRERAGVNYTKSSLGRCMYFDFNINLTARVVVGNSSPWRQPITITTEMLNMGHPNQVTPQNCAVG